jgi:glycosyltransferase involved in cell wall biosynthesis
VLGDGPLRTELQRLAERLGTADRVRLVGARTDARAVLGAADVVIHPSDWEGLPLVVVEAMSAARPVVATAVPGTRELLRDGVDGLLVPSGDAAALGRALGVVLDDPGLACRLGAAAADRALNEFSETAMIVAYRRVWQTLHDARLGAR